MKALLINGSPHVNGNTSIALEEVAKTLNEEGIDTEIVHIGAKAVQGCIACYKCYELGRCVFHDELYEKLLSKLDEADALVVGSPSFLLGREEACLQASCCCGCVPPRRSKRDI